MCMWGGVGVACEWPVCVVCLCGHLAHCIQYPKRGHSVNFALSAVPSLICTFGSLEKHLLRE